MPVTAKFSKEFYDRLGHEIADELVDWFNAVDTIYRSEFRQLFEVNFGRFDAKLEQRTAELRQGMAEMTAELRQEMAEMRTELRGEMAEMRTELRGEIGGIREAMATQETRLIRWAFAFWITALGVISAVIGLLG